MISSKIFFAIIATAMFGLLTAHTTLAQTATQLPAADNNTIAKHLPVQTVQDEHHIVTTVTKAGPPSEGPIVVIPPSESAGNGTILTPGENISNTSPGNITIISPGGNVTEIPGNITNIGNDTVIIAPPDRNITETPGNVTVIDPPPTKPETNQTEQQPSHCTCNQTNATKPSIPPVMVTPAPGQNVTTQPTPITNATKPPVTNSTAPSPGNTKSTTNSTTNTNTTRTSNGTNSNPGNTTTSSNSTTTTNTTKPMPPELPNVTSTKK